VRFKSLPPSSTPPTARAAGRPKPIRGAGALRHVTVAHGFWANAGTALRQAHVTSIVVNRLTHRDAGVMIDRVVGSTCCLQALGRTSSSVPTAFPYSWKG